MPINPERIERLQALGLNEQQARAYLALLDVETSNVQELAKASRVPRAKLYEVLETLNRKGLVEIIPDTPQRFRANSVTTYYDARMEELRAQESELRRTLSDLSLMLSQGSRQASMENGRDYVTMSTGRTHFGAHLRRLVEHAQESLLIIADRCFLARIQRNEDFANRLAVAAQRVQVRIVVPANTQFEAEGHRVRVDELEPYVRQASLNLGDACLMVADQREFVLVHFQPNDLHPSRGDDRVVAGQDTAWATMWHRIGYQIWESSRASVRAQP